MLKIAMSECVQKLTRFSNVRESEKEVTKKKTQQHHPKHRWYATCNENPLNWFFFWHFEIWKKKKIKFHSDSDFPRLDLIQLRWISVSVSPVDTQTGVHTRIQIRQRDEMLFLVKFRVVIITDQILGIKIFGTHSCHTHSLSLNCIAALLNYFTLHEGYKLSSIWTRTLGNNTIHRVNSANGRENKKK